MLAVAGGRTPARGLRVPTTALLWGLQSAFLNPALALLLVSVFHATGGDVGWVLIVYNGSGLIFTLLIPARADRYRDFIGPMLMCVLLTLLLVAVLAATTKLPVAAIGLVVLGGPASVGVSLFFAHLKRTGASPSEVVSTRAVISFAWVAGVPIATLIMGTLGNRAILGAVAATAFLLLPITASFRGKGSAGGTSNAVATATPPHTSEHTAAAPEPGYRALAWLLSGFVVIQGTNAAKVSMMSLYVTQRLDLPVTWSGIALGVGAALEIPALMLISRLNRRHNGFVLVATGCVAAIVYYVAMALVVHSAAELVGLQILNGWSVAATFGLGITLFQDLIPRPGLASGLFGTTQQVGAMISGPIIALGSLTAMGYAFSFVSCAVLTTTALAVIGVASRQFGPAHPRFQTH